MFAIAFDLDVKKTNEHHPKRAQQAYVDIALRVAQFGFKRVQGSVYAANHEGLSRLFEAIKSLEELPWFGPSVKNIRAFRMEQGSDFTAIVKADAREGSGRSSS